MLNDFDMMVDLLAQENERGISAINEQMQNGTLDAFDIIDDR
jgi:hypothetical protein